MGGILISYCNHQLVKNVILLSNGGSSDFINSNFISSDAAAGLVPTKQINPIWCTYKPTNTAGPMFSLSGIP